MFEHEDQMKPFVRAWLHSKGLATKQEFPTQAGVCDLVGCQMRKDAIRVRLQNRQYKALGPLVRVHIWEHIRNVTEHRTVSLSDLTSLFQGILCQEKVREEVERLRNRRFVRQTNSGTFQKINGWHPLHRRLIAVELKLTNWREAFRQAERYLAYAEEAYVALPAHYAKRLHEKEAWNEVSDKSIGVLAIAEDGRTTMLEGSEGVFKRTRAQRAPQTHAVERFWRDRATGKTA